MEKDKIIKKFINRPLSYSSISSYEWDKEEWFKKYALGEPISPSREMEFGSSVDKKIQEDPLYIPEIIRCPEMQYKMEAVIVGIKTIGIADMYHPKELAIRDIKTGRKAWDQKRADETEQLTFYVLLLFVTNKIKPEDVKCFIDWLPTIEKGDFTIAFRDEPPKPITFETKRNISEILKFAVKLKTIKEEMIEYIKNKL